MTTPENITREMIEEIKYANLHGLLTPGLEEQTLFKYIDQLEAELAEKDKEIAQARLAEESYKDGVCNINKNLAAARLEGEAIGEKRGFQVGFDMSRSGLNEESDIPVYPSSTEAYDDYISKREGKA